jgi:catechol 2,3-dioxygenase-like lactoylglutathione lyase family enzyme
MPVIRRVLAPIGAVMLWCLIAGRAAIVGQAPPAPASDSSKGAVIGTGTFTGFVENMDRSLAFYHDAFGMDVPALPASGGRPYNPANPQLFAMFDIAGARERHLSARVPTSRVTVELMEIQDVPHATIPLRIQDPGAATLVFIVRDLEALLTRITQAGGSIATPGGRPVTMEEGRAILVRDVDGRFIELRQPSAAAGQPAGDVVDMRLSLAVNDLARTARVYRDVLGFTSDGETGFRADPALQALTGLTTAQVRRTRVQAPGSTLWIELVEFKGVDRRPLSMRIQDRGAARLQLRAQNVDALVEQMKRAGLKVASTGGVAVPIPPNLKGALVADPDNFFLTPFAPCDGCAPGLGRAAGR